MPSEIVKQFLEAKAEFQGEWVAKATVIGNF